MSYTTNQDTICDKCRKSFSTKSSLKYHKKTSKTCKEISVEEKYKCDYCSKELSTANNLNRHQLTCPEKEKKQIQEKLEGMEKIIKESEEQIKKYQNEIIDKNLIIKQIETQEKQYHKQVETQEKQYQKQLETQEKQIQELQDKLQDLAKIAIDKKSTSNTTTTNIIHGGDLNLYMNKEEIHETIMSKLTKDSIYTGFNGVAKFVVNYIAKINGKQVYFCVDVSRLIFRFHDDKGNEIKDPKAIKILNMLKPSIEQKLYKIREEENTECERLKTLSPANQERIDKLPMCEFTLDKVSKLIFEVFDMLNNNKMASEMAKLLS